MQKAKSILVKFLVLICILCTSLTLAFSLTGCKDGANGKDGVDGKDGVGIQKVEINESTGKLEVTLTDGSKVVVDEEIINTCDHATVKEYQITEGSCVAKAEYLTVCNVDGGCGFAKITEKTVANRHVVNVNNYSQYLGSYYGTDDNITLNGANPCAEGSVFSLVCDCGVVLKTEASNAQHVFCEKNAECGHKTCETSVCHACGEAEEGYVASHGTYTWITVVDNNANICEDGSHKIYVCTDCLTGCTDCEDAIADTQEIAAVGHVVDPATWVVDVEPTLETAGAYKGFCNVCGTNATIVLPALNKEDYNYVQTLAPKCDADGTDTYTFEYFGNELDECVFTVTTTAAHTDANGVVIDRNNIYELDYVQAYGDVEVDGNPTCQETCQGILYCRDCGGIVIVTVVGEHTKGDEIVDRYVPATCVSEGHRYYACEREGCQAEDGIVHEILPVIAHDYKASIDVVNSKIVYTCDCEVEGCTCTATYDVAFFETGVEETPATCNTNGSKKAWYIVTEGSEKVYLEEEVIPAYGHYYKIDASNKHVYKSEAYEYSELVDIFGASNIGATAGYKVQTEVDANTNCEVSATAAVYCSECDGLVFITVFGDHDWTIEAEVGATCYADAYVDYICSANGTHTKRVVAEGTKRSHDLEYSDELSDVENDLIVFVCTYDDCDYALEIQCESWTEVNTESTCTTHGTHYIDYTYIDPVTNAPVSDRLVLVEEKPLSNIHYHGAIALNKDVYTYSELVDIFGASNIGSTQGYDVVTEVDADFNCQNIAAAATYCTECTGLVLIQASGDHDWTAWENVPAKCGEDEYSYRTCKVEGCVDADGNITTEVEVVTGSALSHDYEFVFVKPTLEAAGSVTITCKHGCDLEEVIVLPALNDTDYEVVVVSDNDCANEGLTRYFIDIELDGTVVYQDYVVEIVTPIIEHEGAEPPFIKTWEFNGVTYTGYYCEDCGKIIVTNTAPQA